METFVIENLLDVTPLQQGKKYPVIITRFDELISDEILTIHDDHDPKPLYYQLLERGNIFSWQYLEEGPERWKVAITKNTVDKNEEAIGQIAAQDVRKAEVFKKYGIDFCCGGKKTLKEACIEKGLDLATIENELEQANKTSARYSLPYNDWNLDFLADYIVNTHHSYVKKMLPEIKTYASKVANVHGDRHPELLAIWKLTEEINAELTAHMIKEEEVLFPYIKKMVMAVNNGQQAGVSHFGTIQNPISVMETEHELVGRNLENIRLLSNNYSLPEDACGSYSLLYKMLAEFEDDLHIHVHLENNLLFPKALKMEQTMKG
ncbi:MAG: iron-sulfur cluster repair di-iron protein [Chitinophagaceae bacterium]